MNKEHCDRCNSVIVNDRLSGGPYEHFMITRWVGDDGWESQEVQMCSMCWDDLWEWAFNSDVDRSDKADPMPLDKMANSVRRHIDELESILAEISEAKA